MCVFHQVPSMVRLFLVAAAIFHFHVQIIVASDSEVSVQMPDNETVVMMKIDIKNNKTSNVDRGARLFLCLLRIIHIKC